MGARTERQLKAGLAAEIARLEAERERLAATYGRLPIEIALATGKIEALRWTLAGFGPPAPAPAPGEEETS